jgi:hypothetical protein
MSPKSSSGIFYPDANLISEIANCIENPGSINLLQGLSKEEQTQFLNGFKRADTFGTLNVFLQKCVCKKWLIFFYSSTRSKSVPSCCS